MAQRCAPGGAGADKWRRSNESAMLLLQADMDFHQVLPPESGTTSTDRIRCSRGVRPWKSSSNGKRPNHPTSFHKNWSSKGGHVTVVLKPPDVLTRGGDNFPETGGSCTATRKASRKRGSVVRFTLRLPCVFPLVTKSCGLFLLSGLGLTTRWLVSHMRSP